MIDEGIDDSEDRVQRMGELLANVMIITHTRRTTGYNPPVRAAYSCP